MSDKTDSPDSDTGNSTGNPKNKRLSFHKLKTFESFQIPAYRIYFGAMAGTWFVQSMQNIVRSLLIFRLTGSAADIGIMALALAIPSLLVSFWGGAVADRIPKKYILIGSRAALTLISLGTALLLVFGLISKDRPDSWMLLIVASGIEGIVNGFLQPANMAIIPELVGEKYVMNAISLSTIGQNVFRLASPLLAGWIIDSYGFSSVYLLMTGLYIIATVSTFFIPLTTTSRSVSRGTFGDMVDGIRYLKREAIIFIVAVYALCHVISGQPFNNLLSVFTEDILKVGATGLGLLTTVSAIGSMAGAFVLASLPNRRRGLLLLLSGVVMGAALIIFSFSRWWYLSLALMPLIGFGPTLHSALTAIIVQTYAKPEYRGRMQSIMSISSSLASLGTFLAGVLSAVISIQWSVASLAIFLAVISVLLMMVYPKLRKLD